MAATLKGANTTAQWYEDSYLGAYMPRLEKAVLHSTETSGFPGYNGGASAPNVTYYPLLREIRQHFSNNRSARALRDPSGTAVRENRDGVWQLEIIAYSDYALARSVGGMWIGDLQSYHFDDIARMLIQLNKDHELPLHTEVRWAEGQKTYVSGRRLTGPEFDRAKGIMAHFHVSGNDHWDVGGFYISRLMAAIKRQLGSEDDMSPKDWDREDWDALRDHGHGWWAVNPHTGHRYGWIVRRTWQTGGEFFQGHRSKMSPHRALQLLYQWLSGNDQVQNPHNEGKSSLRHALGRMWHHIFNNIRPDASTALSILEAQDDSGTMRPVSGQVVTVEQVKDADLEIEGRVVDELDVPAEDWPSDEESLAADADATEDGESGS